VSGCARYATTQGRRAAASCAVTLPDTASAASHRAKAAYLPRARGAAEKASAAHYH
jgi:hypothetical protein